MARRPAGRAADRRNPETSFLHLSTLNLGEFVSMYPIRIIFLWIGAHACNLALSAIFEPRRHASVARLRFVEFQQAIRFTAVVADVAMFPIKLIDTSWS
jgi:hypothetical protein